MRVISFGLVSADFARRKPWFPIVLALLGLVSTIGFAVTLGPAQIAISDVWMTIAGHIRISQPQTSSIVDSIVWDLRLPRVLTAGAVGAGLGIAGIVMQTLTQNKLADPYLLGVSSGASVGAVLALSMGLSSFMPIAAFLGSLLALASTFTISTRGGETSTSRTILGGVAVSTLGAALTSLIIFATATGDSYQEILSWLLGSVAGSDWTSVTVSAGVLAVFGIPIFLSTRLLDVLALGYATASSLGVRVSRTRGLLLVATALMTGGLVSVSGSIGFIGLVMPHIVGLVVGSHHRLLVPLTAVVSGSFLIWCDTLARIAFEPRELPVGVLTAILGVPIMVTLLARADAKKIG